MCKREFGEVGVSGSKWRVRPLTRLYKCRRQFSEVDVSGVKEYLKNCITKTLRETL